MTRNRQNEGPKSESSGLVNIENHSLFRVGQNAPAVNAEGALWSQAGRVAAKAQAFACGACRRIHDTRYAPAMPPQLTEVGATYWASTTYVEGAASAWRMAALYGYSYADGKSYEGGLQYVRCVRDASDSPATDVPASELLLLDE
jgi:hypothetical protein